MDDEGAGIEDMPFRSTRRIMEVSGYWLVFSLDRRDSFEAISGVVEGLQRLLDLDPAQVPPCVLIGPTTS